MIKHVSPNHIQAVSQFGEVMAEARRSGPGNLWYVWLTHHQKRSLGRSRAETPHVRVSGKLAEPVQLKLVVAALTATTGLKEDVAGASS